MKNQWIFQDFSKDFFALWSAAFIIIFALLSINHPQFLWILGLITYILIDTGHAYVTSLRTYFDKSESKDPFYYWAPALLFLSMFAWAFSGTPYLWSFVLYATFYHNTRQHYGIFAWYCSLNKVRQSLNKHFIYALTILPFITFHFREMNFQGIYAGNEIFFYPSLLLYKFGISANLVLFAMFGLYNLSLFRKGQWSTPVVLSVFIPGLLNFYCLSLAPSMSLVLLPLLAIHGIAYFFLVGLTLKRTSRTGASLVKLTVVVLFTAGFFGILERGSAESFVDYLPSLQYRGRWLMSALVSLIILPSLSHYVFDAYIWRKKHPVFNKVLQEN